MSEPPFGSAQNPVPPQQLTTPEGSTPPQNAPATDAPGSSFNSFGGQGAAPPLNSSPPQTVNWGTPQAAQNNPNAFPASQSYPNQGPPQNPVQPYPGGMPGQNPGPPFKKGGSGGFKAAEILLGVGCIGAILLALCGAGIWYFISKIPPTTSGPATPAASTTSTGASGDSTSTSAPPAGSAASSGTVTPPPAIESRESLHNLKQLGTAMIAYSQDNNDKFPPMDSAESVKKALFPYLKANSIFLVPSTLHPYQPNAALSGKTLSSVTNPAAVVAFYEPDADADGGRCVDFVDGHAKWIQPSEWDALKSAPSFTAAGSASSSNSAASSGSSSNSASSSSTPSTGDGSSRSPSSGDSSAQEALQALVQKTVSKFTLLTSSPDTAVIKNGGAKAAISATYSANNGVHIEHILIQWASYNSSDSFTNRVVDKFLADGYTMMDKKPLRIGNREVGKQMLLRKGDLEMILWTHQDKCFVAIGPPGDTLDFYKHTAY
ncbi:MAG: hypothetical protein M3Y56_10190 [Armatimonadota bacterium]|nr:hypothetical protein [Armatimonadota bacterium]